MSDVLYGVVDLLDRIRWQADHPEHAPVFVHPGLSWREQLRGYRHNYACKRAEIDAGLGHWFDGQADLIAEWPLLMTPIERVVWRHVRTMGMALWPQFPVGSKVVDFGNPVLRVALECDGREYHHWGEDDHRDAELALMGWSVFHIPGSWCVAEEDIEDIDKPEGEAADDNAWFWGDETPEARKWRRMLELTANRNCMLRTLADAKRLCDDRMP